MSLPPSVGQGIAIPETVQRAAEASQAGKSCRCELWEKTKEALLKISELAIKFRQENTYSATYFLKQM